MDVTAPDITARMAAYYRRRAAEYEHVYHKPERQADLRALESWLAAPGGPFAGRRVLEVACGTGWWTPHGARHCAQWLATDVNAETLAIAQAKPLPPGKVEFAIVDAYRLASLGERRFDAAFAGFWWSHLPLARLAAWLAALHQRLQPGARVVFVDNRFVPTSSTPVSRRDADGNTYQQRTLDDGSTHEVLKNFPTGDEARAAVGPAARDLRWTEYRHYWVLDYTLA